MEAVPADASLGMLLDCHLEFENGRHTRAVKKNDVLRIVDGPSEGTTSSGVREGMLGGP